MFLRVIGNFLLAVVVLVVVNVYGFHIYHSIDTQCTQYHYCHHWLLVASDASRELGVC